MRLALNRRGMTTVPVLLAALVAVGWTAVVSTVGRAQEKALNDLSNAFESLVEEISPAVVQIFSTGYGPTKGMETASGLLTTKRNTGSGVILDPTGYIVTNAHVVEGARRVQVVLPILDSEVKERRSILKPKGKRVGAQIIGVDRETDLAVLKVEAKGLPHLELSDSDNVRQGQIVLAFGSPFGLENSVSMGVVSAVSRQLRPEDPMIFIQTDATINPGNSGGPLVDTQGNVVGINTMILSHAGGSEGVGFAAPSNIVLNVYNQFRATGRVRRGQIGINAQTITPTMAAALELPVGWGVIVSDVYPGGPAESAGLQIGDIITTLDGKTMENGRQFDVNLYRRSIGDEVTLEVNRGGTSRRIQVTVIERQDDPARFSELVRPEENLIPKLGILCLNLTPQIQQMLPPLRENDGVVVAARAANAPFHNEGLLPGDVIHGLSRRPIRNLKELREAVSKLQVGDPVVAQIERNGRFMFIAFEIDL